jgi:hypothetical protein
MPTVRKFGILGDHGQQPPPQLRVSTGAGNRHGVDVVHAGVLGDLVVDTSVV